MAAELPSLNALRVFEAAARHRSIKEAARELYVTPGAVSQQIKGLEDALGGPLFVRLHRGIALTEAGEALWATVSEALQRIADTIERAFPSAEAGVLTVSVLPSFAAKWLVPRLGLFRRRCPEVDVRVSASPRVVDFRREDVDVAIRHGPGGYPGLHSEWLLSGAIFPVCSPNLMGGKQPLRTPPDLARMTLLHSDPPDDWQIWLRAHGITGINAQRGPRFSDDGLMLEAAIDGQGVAISREILVAEDMARGLLVAPFGRMRVDDWDFFVVCPQSTAEQPKIVAFREWILEEARQTGFTGHGAARARKR